MYHKAAMLRLHCNIYTVEDKVSLECSFGVVEVGLDEEDHSNIEDYKY